MPKANPAELMKLPPEVRRKIEGMDGDLREAEHSLKTLEDIGMDVTDLKAKIDWAKQIRTTLLREFG